MSVANRLHGEIIRMCHAFGEWSVNRESCVIAPFPIHAELAARIGTHREAVSRELAQLKAESIIRQHGRSLHVNSVAKLRVLYERAGR